MRRVAKSPFGPLIVETTVYGISAVRLATRLSGRPAAQSDERGDEPDESGAAMLM